MLVVVTTIPEMLREFGGRRIIWPDGDRTTTVRIDPSLAVTIWLTVPSETPAALFTVRPVASPGSAVAGTDARASTLF